MYYDVDRRAERTRVPLLQKQLRLEFEGEDGGRYYCIYKPVFIREAIREESIRK